MTGVRTKLAEGRTPAMHEWRPLLGQMLRGLTSSGGMQLQGA